MFDIGFWELTLIGIVALLVIGPERLPKVARTVGLWVGRMRGFVLSVKADIDKEMRAEELKRIMDEQARSTGLHEMFEETKESLDELDKPDYLVKAVPPAQEKSDTDRAAEEGDSAKSHPDKGDAGSGTTTKND
jgi:sec-independent protein translocase protein TatB